jgi:arginine utilization regulatory protein
MLTKHFISTFNDDLYLQVAGVTKKVESIFLNYDWPGNVRELEHVIKGAMHILDGKSIRMMDLPKYLSKVKSSGSILIEDTGLSLKESLLRVEKQLIEKAMTDSDDNITQASKKLGIPRQTLQYKLKKLETI